MKHPLVSIILLFCLIVHSAFSQAQTYVVTSFGAVGDDSTLNTAAIQKAIDQCSRTGGRVVIPAGVFLTGTLYMRSHVELHLDRGAELKGSPSFNDYPVNSVQYPNAYTTSVDGKVLLSRALIFAEAQQHIAFTGEGTINGNGASAAFQLGNDGGSAASKQRPCGLLIINCRNILMQGLHLRNSAYWMQNDIGCDSLHIKAIDVYNHANYNEDGMDIDARNVLIEDCHIDADDDGICFKNHERDHICENILVRNCDISSNCNAIKFGTVSIGGFKNVKIENCHITPCKTDNIRHWQSHVRFIGLPVTVLSGIALEAVDGAHIENVSISNIDIKGVQTPIFIVLGNKGRNAVGTTGRSPVGSIRNILIEKVKAESYSRMPSSITAFPGYYVEDIRLKDIAITGMGKGTAEEGKIKLPEKPDAYPENRMYGEVYPASGFFIRHAKHISFENVTLKLRNKDCRSNIVLEDVQDMHFRHLVMDTPSCGVPAVQIDSSRMAGDTPVSFSADWITCPDANPKGYGVYYLRKSFELITKPASFIVHLSGDQRYRLLVNGHPACFGPARGDLRNWNYETVDLAPFLRVGKNVLAVQLWNMGAGAPAAQVSYQTAFILQGDTRAESFVNTDTSWKVTKNEGYFPEPFPAARLASYIAGSCDSVDFTKYPFGWEKIDFNDREWSAARAEAKSRYFNEKRRLIPRSIPMMEQKEEPIAGIVRLTGLPASIIPTFERDGEIHVPANTRATILFDVRALTIAYPEITFSGGAHGRVRITYAESLFDAKGLKGNRDQVDGKRIRGYYDVFLPDGGENRLFRPLWLRTFRYIQFDISTGNEPLVLDKLVSIFTAYPFEQKGSFVSNDSVLNTIWAVGWRTARLCANETYMDCPYYEQLQYVGDTRIQALISLYVSGDDRLIRNAIEQFHQSQIPDGLTADAYPAGNSNIIPPFSLFWISMIDDYYRYRDDRQFIKRYLVPMEAVLQWFEERIDPKTQMLGKLGYWNFVDWSFQKKGVPPGGMEGNSSILSLQYVYTLEQAAAIFRSFHNPMAAHYQALARKIKKAVFAACYDKKRGLLADSPEKSSFSQHANIWAILTDCIPEGRQRAIMIKIIKDTSLIQTSLYYRFYFTRALKKSGLSNLYLTTLQPWKDMLALGLTTFPETSAPTVRSDCHAWSASPCYDFLATLCGIESEAPGFRAVRIEPHPGDLTQFSGIVPHPNGLIKVAYKKLAAGLYSARIELPPHLAGHFISDGKSIPLASGKQTLEFRLHPVH